MKERNGRGNVFSKQLPNSWDALQRRGNNKIRFINNTSAKSNSSGARISCQQQLQSNLEEKRQKYETKRREEGGAGFKIPQGSYWSSRGWFPAGEGARLLGEACLRPLPVTEDCVSSSETRRKNFLSSQHLGRRQTCPGRLLTHTCSPRRLKGPANVVQSAEARKRRSRPPWLEDRGRWQFAPGKPEKWGRMGPPASLHLLHFIKGLGE